MEVSERFSKLVRILDPDKGATLADYRNALDYFVKPNLELILDAIAAEADGMPGPALARMSSLLCSLHGSLALWEHIDREIFGATSHEKSLIESAIVGAARK